MGDDRGNCDFAQLLDAAGAVLTRGVLGIWRTGAWRRRVVGFAALALILQGLSLFTPAARLSSAEAAFAALSSLPGAASAGTILCLNGGADDGSSKAPVHHHDSGACPMCQLIGCSLAGAPAPAPLLRLEQRLAFALPLPLGETAPRAPPRIAAKPRGPPALA